MLLISGCVSGPRVTPCVLDPLASKSYCAPASGGEIKEKPISEMESYTCLSPDDTQVLLEWIKRHNKKKGASNGTEAN